MVSVPRLLLVLSSIPLAFGCTDVGDDPADVIADGTESSGSGRAGPTNAFVLAHGFGGDRQNGFGDGLAEALIAAGHRVHKAEVPATDSVAVRGAALAVEIDAFMAASGADSVHVIAHSMGGLDSRYAISTLGYGGTIKSLTTLSSPHQGTPLADVALGLIDAAPADQQAATDVFADLLEGTILDPAAFERGVRDLAEASAPAFNAANPDDPAVVYTSFAGFSTPLGIENANAAALCAAGGAIVPEPDKLRPLLFLAAPIVTGVDQRPNDGVVPVDSGIWGDYRGCIAADHIDQTGAFDTGNAGIDVEAFYVTLAAELAALP